MAIIQVFAKPPVAGKVKTRLIAELGEKVATDIYRFCLDYSLDMVRRSGYEYQIWLSEDSGDEIFRGEAYNLQQGADLGSRMLQAISSQLQPNDSAKVVLIGSDCLDITFSHLQQALEALDNNDIVLLPALDGGYALIACRKVDARLFAEVKWSSSQVLEQTLENARNLNYSVKILETVRDIDTLLDVNHYAELKSLI